MEIRPEFIREYLDRAMPPIEAFGGHYLASTTEIELLEGVGQPVRYVMVEFESRDRARAWYSSAADAGALEAKDKALVRRPMLVDGKID